MIPSLKELSVAQLSLLSRLAGDAFLEMLPEVSKQAEEFGIPAELATSGTFMALLAFVMSAACEACGEEEFRKMCETVVAGGIPDPSPFNFS